MTPRKSTPRAALGGNIFVNEPTRVVNDHFQPPPNTVNEATSFVNEVPQAPVDPPPAPVDPHAYGLMPYNPVMYQDHFQTHYPPPPQPEYAGSSIPPPWAEDLSARMQQLHLQTDHIHRRMDRWETVYSARMSREDERQRQREAEDVERWRTMYDFMGNFEHYFLHQTVDSARR